MLKIFLFLAAAFTTLTAMNIIFPEPASGSALRRFNVQNVPKVYLDAVKELESMMIMPKGFEKQESKQTNVLNRMQPRNAEQKVAGNRAEDTDEAKVRFFHNAKQVPFPIDEDEVNLEPSVEAAILRTVLMKGDIIHWRRDQLKQFKDISNSLKDLSAKLIKNQPPHVKWTSVGSHPALMAALIDAMDWPDKDFAYHQCLNGFPITGVATPTGIWRDKCPNKMKNDFSKFKRNTFSTKENKETSIRIQRELISDHKKAQASKDPKAMEAIQATWRASMKEVHVKKSAEGPFTMKQMEKCFGVGKFRPIKRFSVFQGGVKFRPVDNASENGLNETYITRECIQLMQGDWLAAAGKRLHQLLGDDIKFDWAQVGATSDDEENAFRASPVSTPEDTVVFATDPESGKVMAFIIKGHNFGLAAAMVNYCRKMAFLIEVSRRWFAAITHYFVDDVTSVEMKISVGPTLTARRGNEQYEIAPMSSQGILHFIASIFGTILTIDKEKMKPWSTVATSCGVTTDFSKWKHGIIAMRIKDSTREKAIVSLSSILEDGNKITKKRAASAAGLSRYVGSCMGRVGSAAVQPLMKRANFKGELH